MENGYTFVRIHDIWEYITKMDAQYPVNKRARDAALGKLYIKNEDGSFVKLSRRVHFTSVYVWEVFDAIRKWEVYTWSPWEAQEYHPKTELKGDKDGDRE